MQKLLITIIMAMMSLRCTDHVTDEHQQVKAVEEAVETFRQTMLQPDQSKFEILTSPLLSYGHSNGVVEDRATCIASMVEGKFKFNSITLADQTIDIEGNTAIVRHQLFANTQDAGKAPGTVTLKVLQVWHLHDGRWCLLARQAVKI